jgi:inner membrane protein COX18
MLYAVHTTTGTPWFLTLPIFALCLNLFTRLPTTIYSRSIARRRAMVHPLSIAYVARIRADMERAVGEKAAQIKAKAQAHGGKVQPGPELMDLGHLTREMVKASAAEEKARSKRWGTQAWKNWVPPLAVFPFWMLGIEGVRRMCGGPRGILGSMIFGRGRYEELQQAAQAAGQGGVVDAAAKTVDGGSVVGGQELGMAGEVDLSTLATESAEGMKALATSSVAPGQAEVQEALASLADQSMTTGGCLWFPDLTVADPLHILPFALSAVMVLNIMPKSQAAWRQLLGSNTALGPELARDKWRLRVHRALLMGAVAIGPLTMDLPAAIHLYWISSAAISFAQTTLVWRWMRVRNIIPAASNEEHLVILPAREGTKKP